MNSFIQSNPFVARLFAVIATFALLLSLVPMQAGAVVAVDPECDPGYILDEAFNCVPDTPENPCAEGQVYNPETEECQGGGICPDQLSTNYPICDDGEPKVDVSSNLEGVQTSVPKGLTANDGACEYLVEYTMCKTDVAGTPLADWEITLSNGKGSNFVLYTAVETGCVTKTVDALSGPYTASETVNTGWLQSSVSVSPDFPAQVETNDAGDEVCVFNHVIAGSVNDREPVENYSVSPDEYTCTFVNELKPEVPPTPVLGCTDRTATNFNPAATKGNAEANNCDYTTDAVCISPNLLQNGSFEEPVIDVQWKIFNNPLVPGWLVSLSNGLEIWRNFDGYVVGLASDGVQNAELGANSPTKITQATTTIPGATYKLSFDFSPRKSRTLADNQMQVAVEGDNFMTVADNGVGNTGNVWTAHAKTFVAADDSTEISFEDIGSAVGSDISHGTLVDNVVLCLVEEPVVDVCPLIDGVQTDVDQCTPPPPPVDVCEVTIVSDTTNTVVERAGAFANLITYPWTALVSGASWIWADSTVQDPVNEEIYTFEKTFTWNGPVSDSVLDIAADNSYEVFLNGVSIGSSSDENNHADSTQDQYTGFTPVTGENTLSVKVRNWAQNGGTAQTNPAGLLYKMTVSGDETIDCTTVPDGDGDGDGDNDGGGGDDQDDGRRSSSGTQTDRSNGPDTRVAGESISREPLVLGEQVSAVPQGAAAAGGGATSPIAIDFGTLGAVALLSRGRKNA